MLVRSLILIVLIGLCFISPAQSTYRVQYPLPASTSVTSWGVNADVNNLTVDDPSIQSMSDAGARFLRVDLKWANVEKTAGIYDFSFYDPLMSLLQARGMRAILILDYGNPLYNSGLAPADDVTRAAFVNFVTASVTRYQGQGVIWEIWNEPNEDKFWKPAANVNDYATLALLVAQDIRAIAPDEWIVGPGSSGFDWPFIEACFQRGLLQYWDAVSVHPYRSQAIPETALPDYERLKSMVEQYRPPGKTISLVDTEWGYSLGWVNQDVDVQAKYDIRCKLVDMLSGTRTSITYSWRDQSSGNPDNSNSFGLHDATLAERESGTAYRVIAGAIKGYKFITRLDVGSSSDYCMLFASGTTVKMIVWTTAAPHVVILPSSPGSFSGIDMLGNAFSVATVTPGLALTITDRPSVVRNTTSNALLKAITNWGRLPNSAVIGTVSQLQKAIGAAVVCSSWQYAPAGTTLTLRDEFPVDQIFSLATTSSTLSNLASLTLDAPNVQQAFAVDCRRFDMTEGARIMHVTITTPDGASATQSCLLFQPTPIRLTVMTPQNNALTFRAENTSGKAFQGGIKILANGHSADFDLSFAAGELSKTFFASAISRQDIQTGLNMEVLPAGVYVPGTNNFVPSSQTVIVNRLPDPVSGGYNALVEAIPTVTVTANVSVVPAPGGGGITGMKSLRLDYSFGTGVADIALVPPLTVQNTVWPGRASMLGVWVFADGQLNSLHCRYVDSTGQTFEAVAGTLDWKGWKYLAIPLTGVAASWSGGAADGFVHGQIRIVSPAVLVSQNSVASSGTIYIAGPTLVSSSL